MTPLATRAFAPHASSMDAQDNAAARALAMVRRATPASPEERAEIRDLLAEVESDPSTWLTDEELMAKLTELRANVDDTE